MPFCTYRRDFLFSGATGFSLLGQNKDTNLFCKYKKHLNVQVSDIPMFLCLSSNKFHLRIISLFYSAFFFLYLKQKNPLLFVFLQIYPILSYPVRRDIFSQQVTHKSYESPGSPSGFQSKWLSLVKMFEGETNDLL